MSNQDAQRMLRVMDERVDANLREKVEKWHVGTVASVDTTKRIASVTLHGNSTASPGFSYPAYMKPAVGDVVRVMISPNGYRWIENLQTGEQRTDGAIRLENTNVANKGLLFGPAADVNLYRMSGALRTDGSLDLGGSLSVASSASLGSLTVDNDASIAGVTTPTGGLASPARLNAINGVNDGGKLEFDGAGAATNWSIDQFSTDLRLRKDNTTHVSFPTSGGINIGTSSRLVAGASSLQVLTQAGAALRADALSLKLSSNLADPSPPTAGIQFGADVSMYRANANHLHVDDYLSYKQGGRQMLKTTTFAVGNNAWTKITSFDSTDFGSTSPFVSWNSGGWTEMKALIAGVYLIVIEVDWQAGTAGTRRIIAPSFGTNGGNPATTPNNDDEVSASVYGGLDFHYSAAWVRELAVNDTVSAFVFQGNGGALNLQYARFGVFYLGGV